MNPITLHIAVEGSPADVVNTFHRLAGNTHSPTPNATTTTVLPHALNKNVYHRWDQQTIQALMQSSDQNMNNVLSRLALEPDGVTREQWAQVLQRDDYTIRTALTRIARVTTMINRRYKLNLPKPVLKLSLRYILNNDIKQFIKSSTEPEVSPQESAPIFR